MAKDIEIKNVSMIFSSKTGNVQALKDVSFDVEKNEFVSIVGPSGCGKSTLLRIVMGLQKPSVGQANVMGKKVEKPTREMSMAFQDPTLMRWRTVTENVLLPIETLKLKKDDYRKKAQDLLELVGLKGFEKFYPEELSGGMRARVSVCRCLITNPEIVLMDEPFGPLDALTRLTMDFELLRIRHEQKKTFLFVTHDVEESVFLSDRVVVMSCRPGCIQDIVKVDLPRPRNLSVRGTKKFIDYSTHILRELGVER